MDHPRSGRNNYLIFRRNVNVIDLQTENIADISGEDWIGREEFMEPVQVLRNTGCIIWMFGIIRDDRNDDAAKEAPLTRRRKDPRYAGQRLERAPGDEGSCIAFNSPRYMVYEIKGK